MALDKVDAFANLHADAYFLVQAMRETFVDYYTNHRRKQLSSPDKEVRKSAMMKADANWERAVKCQEFLDKYPLPDITVPPQVNPEDYKNVSI